MSHRCIFIGYLWYAEWFRLEILSVIDLLSLVAVFRNSAMTRFDFTRAGAPHQQMAPSAVTHSFFLHRQRVRPRAGLGAIGMLLVLMSVGIGVLTIRFILVFARTVLQ